MDSLTRPLRLIARPLTFVLALGAAAVLGWARRSRRSRHLRRQRIAASRAVLPSLYELHPGAATAARRALGLQTVLIDQIVGTLRRPSQNTADFLPLPQLRGNNWAGRWQRILRATDRLDVLPPVELVKLGDEYYVADGHNRVAAARSVGAVAVDADVTELIPAGSEAPPPPVGSLSSSLAGAEEIREAAAGRHSRTAEHRFDADEVARRDLLRRVEAEPGE
jgi:hypothetical protein